MHEGRQNTIIGNLGNYIDNSEETKIYNTSKGKNFSGNIILFINNSFQYEKRFKKNLCCELNFIDYENLKICKKCGYIKNNT